MRVGQLWKALPLVSLDMNLMRSEMLHYVLHEISLERVSVEEHLRFKQVPHGPKPLWTLMVVPPLALIRVHVISPVIAVLGIQGLNTHATFLHKDGFNQQKTSLCIEG